MICGAYLLAWTPYAAVALCYMLGGPEVPVGVSVMASFFAKGCICYNPLVYFLSVARFRSDVLEAFGRRRITPDNENTSQVGSGSRRYVNTSSVM